MSQQSQSAGMLIDENFLSDMYTWDEEKCRDQWKTLLPTVLLKLEEAAYIKESIGVLQFLCQAFVPCIPMEELEDRLFSRLCGTICSLIDSTLNKIHLNTKGVLKDTTAEVKSVLGECIEWLLDVCHCLELCIKHVCSVSVQCVELSHIKSLLACAIAVLKKTFTHCKFSSFSLPCDPTQLDHNKMVLPNLVSRAATEKESADVYGELLDELSEPLSAVFKQAHVLQVALLSTLDKLRVSGPPLEENVLLLTSVCEGLFEVCTLVSHLDVKLTISLWKGISRVCTQHIALLRDRLEVGPFINFLCKEIRTAYVYLFTLCQPPDENSLSQGDDQLFTKSVRLLGFQMKVLVAFLRDFTDYLGDCESEVIQLLVTLLRSLPPCLHVQPLSTKQESEIRSHVTNASAPIISHLLTNKAFRIGIVGSPTPSENCAESYVPYLMLQLMILDVIPKQNDEVMSFWLCPINHSDKEPTADLLSAIFQSLKKCWVELRVPVMVPGVMVAGKAQREVSLYEHVATHISGYIGACREKHFSQLESVLLANVVKDDPLSNALACDCWCFLVRYSTAQVCKEQVYALIQAYLKLKGRRSKVQSKKCERLLHLISRLIKFMAPGDQINLVRDFPPRSHIDLWFTLNFKGLHPEAGSQVKEALVPWCMETLRTAKCRHCHVCQAMHLLTKLLSNQDSNPQYPALSDYQKAELIDALITLWGHMPDTDFGSKSPLGQTRLCLLLELTKGFIRSMEEKDVLKILNAVQSCVLQKECSIDVCRAVADLLTSLSTTVVHTQAIDWQVVPELLQQLVLDPQRLVHYSGVKAVTCLTSDPTWREKVLPIIHEHDWLKAEVIKYSQQPQLTPEPGFDVVTFLQEQFNRKEIDQNDEKTSTTSADPSKSPSVHNEEKRKEKEEKGMENVLERSNGEEEEVSEPAEKKARLCPSNTDAVDIDVETQDPADQNDKPQSLENDHYYRALLDKLTSVVASLEKECSNNRSPPAWFMSAAKTNVLRISECLESRDWFDDLT